MIQAADEMMLNSNEELAEWVIIERLMEKGATIGHYLGFIPEFKLLRWTGITEIYPTDTNAQSNRIFAALALIKCNTAAMEKFEKSRASFAFTKGAKERLKSESNMQVGMAQDAVEKWSVEDVKKCTTRRGAGKVLKEQLQLVN